MSKHQHPYEQYKKDKLWPVVTKAVNALVRNGDINEKTDRNYIVGYLIKSMRESSALDESQPLKKQRIIEMKPHEQILVRAE